MTENSQSRVARRKAEQIKIKIKRQYGKELLKLQLH